MKPLALLTLLSLLLAACAAHVPRSGTSPVATATVAPGLTPSPSPTLAPTATPLPPASTATPAPIQGTLTIKVNVRSGPGTTYTSLGQLNAGEKVLISAKDQTGAWYRILYPAAPDGSGWVAAQFVQLGAGAAVPLEATPTPAGPSGRVLQRLNVRSGPGLSFASLGVLEPDALVSLTGKNATAAWLQIEYPSGPPVLAPQVQAGGRGWVTAQYILTDATDLPVLDDFGTPVAGSASGPTPVPVTPTATVGPAFADGDSSAAPAVRLTFSASGTRAFTYSSQVSAPAGDPEDWLAFTPYAVNRPDARLVFSLACSGNAALTVEILQGGSLVSGWGTLVCGDLDKQISLPAGQTYALRLSPAPGAGLRLVDYTLTVQNLP